MFIAVLVGCFPALDKVGGDSSEFDSGTADSARDTTGDTGTGDTSESNCGDDDADGDGYCGADDCEEGVASVHVGAAEACNGADDDCDGDVDEGVLANYYIDEDGDGYGGSEPVRACDAPANAVDNGADCNDGAANVYPDAADDTNDDIDNDCDGDIDEDVPEELASPEVDLDWDSTGADVTITGAATGWDFGMSETGAGSPGWFGETCIPGDEPYGYADYGFDICHELGSAGGQLERVFSVGDLEDGTTLFSDTTSVNITYFLERHDDGACFVWGDDPAYYAELGCEELP